MSNEKTSNPATVAIAPKYVKPQQWNGYSNPPWFKKDKKKVTVLFNFVERRKSYFLQAYFHRRGYKYRDLGDHCYEDVRWGKEYGNRMECNPMYFTSGSIIKALFQIEKETGLSKNEIAKKYIFLGGGGQCGPCRYGMYPQEYLKAINDAGFKDFRILIFSSDIIQDPMPRGSAFNFNLPFKIEILIAIILADFIHIAECALRPFAKDKKYALSVLTKGEQMLLEAFKSPFYFLTIPATLKKVSKMFSDIPRYKMQLPKIYVTGEFFANLAHNDGNYNLRRFIMDEGCEVYPGIFTQRVLYDNWRRTCEAVRGIKYASNIKERNFYKSSLRKQKVSTAVVNFIYKHFLKAFNPAAFGGKADILDLNRLAEVGRPYYHPEIFGGEGNLEIAEAIYYADKVDGFISSKPFGCMPSSGVSDGVQAKIMSMYPQLNFLSIETSGDNEVNILSRVSMLLFKAKQKIRLDTSAKKS